MFATRALQSARPRMPAPKPKYGLSLRKQVLQAKQLGFKGRDRLRMAFGIFGNQRWWRGFYWTNRYKWNERRWYKQWRTADDNYTYYSNAMDACIQFRTTNRVKNDIDHFGGLDNYLLNTRHKLGPRALATKKMIQERVEELKARGEWKPFPGLKDGPDFPTTFVNQLKLDKFVREALKDQVQSVEKGDEYTCAVRNLSLPRTPLLPHEVDGAQLFIE
ncbi:MAG: hypothetical protein BJ554DRAFT_6741 [Olpidium bornovanus]|uniref:Uncharacterized protein n=1 Tax=Olpidium bornovanus TaxID=278681 RepID=A0A8H7ZXC1_9FUNG|nr:MAG: hypothetical protein BJ554DRAFT_6741 [Olpidium bornovanus]